MDLIQFNLLSVAAELRFQRCLYIISPKPDVSLGILGGWHKIGMAQVSLSRLANYKTYWPSGVLIHAIAVVPQDTKSTRCTIKDVEAKICNSHVLRRARIRETESFKGLNKTHITYILASLK